MKSRASMIVDAVVVLMVLMVSLTDGARRRDAVEVAEERGSRIVKRGLNDVGAKLGMPEGADLQLQDSMMTAQGTERRKYQETFKGKKVFDTLVDTETEGSNGKDGDLEVIDGSIFDDLEDLIDNFFCILTNDEAKQITLKYMGLSSANVFFERYDEFIYVDETTKKSTYVAEVELSLTSTTGEMGIVRPYAFVDQCTREVVFAYDRAGSFAEEAAHAVGQMGERRKRFFDDDLLGDDFLGGAGLPPLGGAGLPPSTGTSTPPAKPSGPPVSSCDVKDKGGNPKRTVLFGQGGRCLNPMLRTKDKKWCYLENEYVKTVDLKHSTDSSKTDVASFECSKGLDDEVNGGYSATLDGFYFTSKTFEMYKNWYGYKPLKGYKPFVKVHYKKNYSNAHWDGQSLVFGDSSVGRYPTTVLNIVSHELGHGVVEKASGLQYKGQSGGMNEAFADMAGETAEFFVFGTTDWKVAADMFRETGALRYFDDPTKDGVSIKHASKYVEGMDVHYSSGLYNHVFWYLSERQNLGIRAAFECFLRANRLYWKPTTNFEQGACGVIRGAYDAAYDMDRVAASFRFVGIKLNKCTDLSKYVTAVLKPGYFQNRVRVSNLRQPLFKMTVPFGTSQLNVKATGGVGVVISKSYKRTAAPLASGVGSATAHVSGGMTVYIRLWKNSPGDRYVRVQPTIVANTPRQQNQDWSMFR